MRVFRNALALLLSYALGVQPAVAQIQERVSISAVGRASAGTIRLQTLALTPSLSFPAALSVGAANVALPAAAFRLSQVSAAIARTSTPAAMPAATPTENVARIRGEADRAIAGVENASGGESAIGKAGGQFAALTRDHFTAPDNGAPLPVSVHEEALAHAILGKPAPTEASEAKKEAFPEPPKLGFFQVSRDPELNKSFWRYLIGNSLFLFGYQMYLVSQPYMIASLTKNSLTAHKDPRAATPAALDAVINANRSWGRLAHWTSQALSYVLLPLFTGNPKEGPARWLKRANLVRAAAVAAIMATFFMTGVFSLPAVMAMQCAYMAAQAFFQGISVAKEGIADNVLFGGKTLTSDERTKMNSILSISGSVIGFIGLLTAGQIAGIGPILGKAGAGGAVNYGVYAVFLAVSGFIMSGIKLFRLPQQPVAADVPPAPKGLGGVLKSLWSPIWSGARIVMKDRLLRTMALLSMITAMFSDPLIMNVLPTYIDDLVVKNQGTVGWIMTVPVLGALLKLLTSTPMGNWSLMIAMAYLGSIVAALLIKPMNRLFGRIGFKTDEALTIPFYVLAALEAPLFYFMIHAPTVLAAVALYGFQALLGGFIGIAVSGLYQKKIGEHPDDVSKIQVANSLFGIAVTILSLALYLYVGRWHISTATWLIAAAIATGFESLVRIAAPFLSFTRDQRKPQPEKTLEAPSAAPMPAGAKPGKRKSPALFEPLSGVGGLKPLASTGNALRLMGRHRGPGSILSNGL